MASMKKGSEFILAAALAFTAITVVRVIANEQRISIEQEGIIQTIKCPHPQILDRDVKVVLVRFPNSKVPDRPGVDIARINEFFRRLLDKNPGGYQLDAIRPFGAAPKTTRDGVLSVSEKDQAIVLDYVRKVRGIGSFQARISEKGIEVLDKEPPAGIDSFIESFFDKNGCEVDHKKVDPKFPNRLFIERIHSLKEYGLDGEMKTPLAK